MNSCGTWNHGMLDLQSISSMIPSTTRIHSLSQEDKDSIFQHGILVYNLVSNRPSSLSFHPFPTSQPLSRLASSTTFSRKSGLHVKSPNFHWKLLCEHPLLPTQKSTSYEEGKLCIRATGLLMVVKQAYSYCTGLKETVRVIYSQPCLSLQALIFLSVKWRYRTHL